jgi:hypothetical protein
MVEDMYRWRPVPRRFRCDRCPEPASVLFDNRYLCSECFESESKRRYGPSDDPVDDPGPVHKEDTRSVSRATH